MPEDIPIGSMERVNQVLMVFYMGVCGRMFMLSKSTMYMEDYFMDNELQCNGDLVTINNHKMHIYRKGNKDNPTLVFMSGGGTVSPVYDFKVLYDKLTNYFRIIVIEKFGYGYSDIIKCSHDIDTIVAIEKEALNILGEEAPYILAPHSMSGLEAIRWKQLYPELVMGIIGIDMATPLSYKNWTREKIAKQIKLLKFYRKLKIQNRLGKF